jgi:hypothetical protein
MARSDSGDRQHPDGHCAGSSSLGHIVCFPAPVSSRGERRDVGNPRQRHARRQLESETFLRKAEATRFRRDVDASGQDWPEGWVKGVGYVSTGPEPIIEVPFLPYGQTYVRDLTGITSRPGTAATGRSPHSTSSCG